MTLSIGQILNNRYRIEQLLGQGGFGAVYQAWDTNLQEWCAVKENLFTSPEAQAQFLKEAKLLYHLVHISLPRVIDYFVLPGQGQYLVMYFVAGQDLEDLLEQNGGPLPEAQVLPWIIQICDALEYLHTQNPPVIHRDIKLSNIRITPEGRAVLVDFGIAKEYTSGVSTTVGARAMTPPYAPPEQYGRGTDAQSDVYALGVSLYILLTNVVPYESIDILSGIAPKPVLANQVNPQVSAHVARAIQQAAEPQRSARLKSAAEFHRLLSAPPAPDPATLVVRQATERLAQTGETAPYRKPSEPAAGTPAAGQARTQVVAATQPGTPATGQARTQVITPTPAAPQAGLAVKSGKVWIPVILILGMVTLCGGLFLAARLAGFAFPLNLPGSDTPTWTALPSPTHVPTSPPLNPQPLATNTPLAPTSEPPTAVPTATSTPARVQIANRDMTAGFLQQKVALMEDLWKPQTDADGNHLFSGQLTQDPILVRFGWCAKTPALLEDNWPKVSFQFIVDNSPIPGENLYYYEYQTTYKNARGGSEPGYCRAYVLGLTALAVGEHIIQAEIYFSADLNDGYATYRAGRVLRDTYKIMFSR